LPGALPVPWFWRKGHAGEIGRKGKGLTTFPMTPVSLWELVGGVRFPLRGERSEGTEFEKSSLKRVNLLSSPRGESESPSQGEIAKDMKRKTSLTENSAVFTSASKWGGEKNSAAGGGSEGEKRALIVTKLSLDRKGKGK